MNWTKSISHHFGVSACLIFLCFACTREDSIELKQLTVSKIITVRPGMTIEQVKNILGEPVGEYSRMHRSIYCPCNSERTCYNVYRRTFVYTKQSRKYSFPMVWVHFNDRDRVHEVYVKKYVHGNKWPIYVTTQDLCDTTDQLVPATALDDPALDSLRQFFK